VPIRGGELFTKRRNRIIPQRFKQGGSTGAGGERRGSGIKRSGESNSRCQSPIMREKRGYSLISTGRRLIRTKGKERGSHLSHNKKKRWSTPPGKGRSSIKKAGGNSQEDGKIGYWSIWLKERKRCFLYAELLGKKTGPIRFFSLVGISEAPGRKKGCNRIA